MKLYCSNCGKLLKHSRKALPKLGLIVDLVTYHECSEVLIPFEIDPSVIIEAAPIEGKDKFVLSLNDLKHPLHPSSMIGTDDLRDRRFEQGKPKSSAPFSVLNQFNSRQNTAESNESNKSNESNESNEFSGE